MKTKQGISFNLNLIKVNKIYFEYLRKPFNIFSVTHNSKHKKNYFVSFTLMTVLDVCGVSGALSSQFLIIHHNSPASPV